SSGRSRSRLAKSAAPTTRLPRPPPRWYVSGTAKAPTGPRSGTSMEPRITSPARLRHLPYLDALRGLAILAVLVNHLLPLPGGLYYGWMGVELFFVLSG